MYLPVPVLAALGIAFLILVIFAFRRGGGARDLMAPPRAGATTPAQPPPPFRTWPVAPIAIADIPPEMADQVRALCAAGRKIEAIKTVRAATGLGLAEAKDLVERM